MRPMTDLMNIYSLGYFYDVVPHLEEVPGARNGVRLVIEVFEYPVVQTLSIESEAVPAEVIRGWMTTQEGRILNVREFENDMFVIQERAVDEYDVYLRPVFVDLNEDTAELTLAFRAARVGEIVMEGHEKTKEHVITREITFEVGDILNRAQVRRTMQRLTMLGYFQSINAEFYETDDPDALGVRFVVEERKTGIASFGAGYSTQDGFIGYVEVADENLFGRGQRVNLRWEFGKTRNTYDLGFYEPYFLGTTTSLGFNLYNRTFEHFGCADHVLGASGRRRRHRRPAAGRIHPRIFALQDGKLGGVPGRRLIELREHPQPDAERPDGHDKSPVLADGRVPQPLVGGASGGIFGRHDAVYQVRSGLQHVPQDR